MSYIPIRPPRDDRPAGERCEVTLRDHFAAAALTGLLGSGDLVIDPRNGTATTLTARDAYRWADAMLREREPTNHDAAPAARASVESVAPQPTTRGDSARTDKAESRPSEGTGDTLSESPNLVSADYRESVAIKYLSWLWAGDSTTDVAVLAEKAFRLADEELARHAKYQCSDRSQPVKDDVSDRSKPISDDRMAALKQLSALDQELELKHGIKGNPMIKPQVNNHPVSYAKNDENRVLYDTKSPRNGALSGCETVPDPDSRVWETPCTPQPQATPPQGSVQGEGSFRDSQNAIEPVAWHINGSEYDTGCEYEYATLERGIAEAATAEGCAVVPLYRHPQPTLTDEEREAMEWCRDNITAMAHKSSAFAYIHADTLRKLLERLQ